MENVQLKKIENRTSEILNLFIMRTKTMKKILATILMLGFVVPVFAKVQKSQTNYGIQTSKQRKEKIEVMKGINTSLSKISEYTDKLKSFTKSNDFARDVIASAAGTFVAIIAFNIISLMYY
jgi:F420-0:gamma-glutamyl ligase-like protein